MFPTATVEGQGVNLHVTHGSDAGLFVRFYWNKIHDAHYVKINVPGDQRTEWDRPVKDSDKVRFRQQWEAYTSQQNQFGAQTMLNGWEGMTEAQVAHFNARNVHTVEQLANMADAMITACGMGTRELVKKAQGHLAEMQSQRQHHEMTEELRKRDAKIAAQDEEMAKVKEQLATLLAAQGEKDAARASPRKANSP